MKKRLDIVLVEQGYFESRERAKKAVLAGTVLIDEIVKDKVGEKVEDSANIRIKGNAIPYVSRGGLKLEKGIKSFGLDPSGKVFLDIGASTGGFTDCLLQNGAEKVYSIDVGYGQLAWKLRNDSRVIVMERQNFRKIDLSLFSEYTIDGAVMDVSFISISKLLPNIYTLLKSGGELLTLIKPQFEAGRETVGKKGVIKDPEIHMCVINRVIKQIQGAGFEIIGIDYSPIRGPKGNTEFLCYCRKTETPPEETIDFASRVSIMVTEAHKSFKKEKGEKS
jgi:23S rRNA (cytidine1920-2'-O)/16S rRNA (cytidine1409-2'-O)-methyltransferase